MRIHIQAVDFELTEGLRAHVERRVQFALSRFQQRVVRLTVRLCDLNGPRGGVDKSCSLQVRLRGLPDIVIEGTEADLYVAINRAADRAGLAVGRQLRRMRAGVDARRIWNNDDWSE